MKAANFSVIVFNDAKGYIEVKTPLSFKFHAVAEYLVLKVRLQEANTSLSRNLLTLHLSSHTLYPNPIYHSVPSKKQSQ